MDQGGYCQPPDHRNRKGCAVARQMMELRVHPVALQRSITGHGLTHRGLAAKVGCSQITITRLANGTRYTVGRVLAEAIEKELNWKPGDLFMLPPVITDRGNSDDQESDAAVSTDSDAA